MSIPASADPSDPKIELSVKSELARLGNTKQCPICGSEVHEDAYHCTKCRSFFCYHCRAHLVANDPILQCSNQDCGYYGKWVCGVCNPVSKKQESPLEYIEPVDGYWPAWLVISVVLSMIVGWYFGWKSAMIAFLGLYPGMGFVLQSMDINIFGKQRKVVMDRTSEVHLCICCSKPTKKTSLRQAAG
ncbi:MAG: hypothetical protein ACKOAU_00550 [Pirellula sp.]